MIYLTDNLTLIEDSLNNLYLFNLEDGKLFCYYFSKRKDTREEKVATNVLKDYVAAIDKEDNIYIFFQNKEHHLKILRINNGGIQEINLSGEPMPRIFNLNLKIVDGQPHIIYYVMLEEKKYRIVHHHYNGEDWLTNIIDDIRVDQVLNPSVLLNYKKDLLLIYNNKREAEEIYLKVFSPREGEWGEAVKLTEDPVSKLYLDSLMINNKFHLVYCTYEEKLLVKYYKFNYSRGKLRKEKELELSHRENIQWPILIYYENKLWVVWIQYENIISRYSEDLGNNWGPTYLWQGVKDQDIVKYNFISHRKEKLLNYAFGTMDQDIRFVGFGPLHRAVKLDLKKKMEFYHPQLPYLKRN